MMELKHQLLGELKQIYESMLQAEQEHAGWIAKVLPQQRDSAVNLINYLSLRSKSIELIQLQLHQLGLSSLASSESHIKHQVAKVIEWLGDKVIEGTTINPETGLTLLNQNVEELLGPSDDEYSIPIMVTFDADFAEDNELMCELLDNGMRIARINCAHDDEKIWGKMIHNLQKAKRRTKRHCKLYMDLAGPKIRTKIVTRKHDHGKLKVKVGDELILTDRKRWAKKPKKFIRCSQPGIIENVKPGQRIFFDDGLFEAKVESVADDSAIVRMVRVASKKAVIKSEKGINFPDSDFTISSITDFDRECLAFITRHADMVGFSFVNNAADMEQLQQELAEINKADFPIVAKIETKRAVEHLPEIILQGMQQGPIGIMVARGDMALEIGFERMSEIQDEILWIGEAAHTPVIWATQVLESLQKKGLATRGEITDAARAGQADCVMINKGEYTIEVLKILNEILTRSRKNFFKNRRLFRQLSIATKFSSSTRRN